MIHVLSISGGKDSTALWLWAIRSGLSPRVAIFADTGWEHAQTYAYLDALEREHIREPLRRVRANVQFADRVRRHGTFPGRINRRWCTRELKIEPFAAELNRIREESGDDVIVLVGERAEESVSRAAKPEREWHALYDCELWRPIHQWTLADVMAEHHRAGVPVNPLYRVGANRVGCWPCVKAGKVELALLGETDPTRMAEVRDLERETGTTMFCLERPRANGAPRKLVPVGIDDAIAWARTERGGVQLRLYREPSGCDAWGLCDAPAADDDAVHAEAEAMGGRGQKVRP